MLKSQHPFKNASGKINIEQSLFSQRDPDLSTRVIQLVLSISLRSMHHCRCHTRVLFLPNMFCAISYRSFEYVINSCSTQITSSAELQQVRFLLESCLLPTSILDKIFMSFLFLQDRISKSFLYISL